MPSFVMVDVEATHSTGSLVLTSITHVVAPPSDCAPAAFLLKRTDGSHTLVVSAPRWIFGPEMNCCALEVEEGSGNSRTVPLVFFDSEKIMQCSLLKGQVPILNSGSNNHPQSWALLISDGVSINDDRGFLFHLNGSCLRVIESTSHCTVVTIEFKRYQPCTLQVKFSS
ncbi:hypothetical protein Pelo_6527 [Pelomyxa schiedti]|nr:hypothetical protein Pelo_6527 [Pelomyxa schiedti]